jgi:Tfp pilus assembly protein PilV
MKQGQSGFSLIDVLIASTILLVGVLALAAAVTGALLRSKESEEQLRARHYAFSTLESVISSRDIGLKTQNATNLNWDRLANVSGNSSGIFLTGEQNIYKDSGTDGIVGTADDSQTNTQTNKPAEKVERLKRKIVITPDTADGNVKRIDVTVYYWAGSFKRSEEITTILTNY